MTARLTHKTPRAPLDFYPTPDDVTGVLVDWLASRVDLRRFNSRFLDPTAGEGHIIRAMRARWRARAFWFAIELDAERADRCRAHADHVVCDNALTCHWTNAHIISNPPFTLLDEMWLRTSAHRARFQRWCAVFMPVAWWNAEKRKDHVRPDHIIALGWRPVFRDQNGPAHKGSQDFMWSILSPMPTPTTSWERVNKPGA